MKNKCIILLSEKSSGSSAIQNLLANYTKISHLENTRHYENESLYWVKASSVLGLKQNNMIASEVPIDMETAKKDIANLLNESLGTNYKASHIDKKTIFHGWELLCKHHSPIFFEKSPHHLLQRSALKLIVEAISKISSVDFIIIGLIRNPMDVLYSYHKRWGVKPEKMEHQWNQAYLNLQELKKIVGDKLVIVRYEEVVHSLKCIYPVLNFCDINLSSVDNNYLHQNSINKWKSDNFFGFNLSHEVMQLALDYGYKRPELVNNSNARYLWQFVKNFRYFVYYTLIFIKKIFQEK